MAPKERRSGTADPFSTALRLLSRRDYAAAELAQRLRDKGHDDVAIATALERCRDLGYLNDTRFAALRARALLRSGRAAGRRILLDLHQRGIDSEAASAALASAEAEHPPGEQLRELLARRYPHFDFASADPGEKRRVVDFFLRRGFDLSLVLSILHAERDRRP